MTDTCPTSAGGVATFQFANLAELRGLRFLNGLVYRLLFLNCGSWGVLCGFLELGHSGALSRSGRGSLSLGLSLRGLSALGRGFGRSLGLGLLNGLFGLGLSLNVVVGGAAAQSECGKVARERCAKRSIHLHNVLDLVNGSGSDSCGLVAALLVVLLSSLLRHGCSVEVWRKMSGKYEMKYVNGNGYVLTLIWLAGV